MNGTTTVARLVRFMFICIVLCVPICNVMAGNVASSSEAEKIQEKKDASAKVKR